MSIPTRLCQTCGRTFSWRKKWARDWEQVRYCSHACQQHRPGDLDRHIEQTILDLLQTRAAAATICPSEVARRIRPFDWRDLMQRVRQAARRLAAQGKIVIRQGGKVVDPSSCRGPIRIGRA